MAILDHLSVLTLRHAVNGACDCLGQAVGERSVERVMAFLINHFTDHSQSLTRAMQRANELSWKALEIALAGESLWNVLDRSDSKAFRQQVRDFLDTARVGDLAGHAPEFRQLCLKELRQARKKGMLSGSLEPVQLARQVGEFARFTDPQSLLEAEWRAVESLANGCREIGCRNLAQLVSLRPDGATEPPLLIVAVRFFFRREVEMDRQLFQGLAWAKFELLQITQEEGFAGLTEVLTAHQEQMEALLESVQVIVLQTHQAVLDIQGEVANLAKRFDLLHRELRPRDSLSISDERERQLVKELVQRYRSLPEEERQRFPMLLNAIGKLEVAAGSFTEAQEDFQQAAALAQDREVQAEAQFNRFGAALETGDFEPALQALQRAAELQPDRYALFPVKKYEPECILGAGGFGVAFLCRNKLTGSRVVVKTLRTDTLARDLTDVFREAQVLEELDHPAVIRLRDCDYADAAMTRPYLVMDYFDGQTLGKYIEDNGPVSAEELVSLIRPVAEALQVAHDRGILHRDVKPGNLLVKKEGPGNWRVKLIDFGLALKQNVLQTSLAGTGSAARTITGYSIAGTLDYAAPEQLGRLPGVSAGPYTDVYGLAKTSCYALFRTTQPLRKHWRDIPEALADLLEQCLSESPEDRLPNFRKMLEGLDRLAPAHEQGAGRTVSGVGEPIPVEDQAKEPASAPGTRKPEWWRETTEATAGKLIHRLGGHADAVLCLAFSPDGRYLLSGSADNTLRVWEAQPGHEVKQLFGHTDKVWSVHFLPDGNLAASSSKDKSVRIWDLERGEELRCFAARTNRSLAVSPDGQLAVTGNLSDGMIRLWELKTGRELRRLKGHMSWVLSLAFSSSGRHILSASADGTIRLWDVHSGRELQRLQGHTDQVWSVAFSPNDRAALSASADKTVRLWDLRTGKEKKYYEPFQEAVWRVAFSPDGYRAACDSDDATLRIWDLETSRAPLSLQGHSAKALCVAFSPDGRFLASGSQDKSIILWRQSE